MLDDPDTAQQRHLSTMQRLVLESEDISSFLQDFTELLADRLTAPVGNGGAPSPCCVTARPRPLSPPGPEPASSTSCRAPSRTDRA